MTFEEVYKLDRFANEAGVELVELVEGRSVMRLVVGKQHLNAGSMAHGGVLFTLADMAMSAVANYKVSPSVSIQSDIRYIAGAAEGDVLTAIGEEVMGRKRLFYSRVTITNQNDELIAVAEGMYHLKQKFELNK